MERPGLKHGFDPKLWEAAKAEARELMYARARMERTISYSELVSQIQSVRMEAPDTRLAHFLGEIAREDDDNGYGLTTVVVVHKSGDMQPGPGFFEMAESQGRDVSDRDSCWAAELKKVYNYWSTHKDR